MDKRVRPFSTGYFILNADIVEHNGNEVIVPNDFYGELANYVTRPLLKFNGSHYWAMPRKTVPSDTVAVPSSIEANTDESILLAKDETRERLVRAGEQPSPT